MIVRTELNLTEEEAMSIFNGFLMASSMMLPNSGISMTQLRKESDDIFVFETTIPIDIIESDDDDIFLLRFEKRKESDYSYNLHKIFGLV